MNNKDATFRRRITRLENALKPFANMHREPDEDNKDEDEMACKRGTGFDATYLFSKDFELAHKVLNEKWGG